MGNNDAGGCGSVFITLIIIGIIASIAPYLLVAVLITVPVLVFLLFKEKKKTKEFGFNEKDLKYKALEINEKIDEINELEKDLDEKEAKIKEWATETARKNKELIIKDQELREKERRLTDKYASQKLSKEISILESKKENLNDEINRLAYRKTELENDIEKFDDFIDYQIENSMETIDNMDGLEFENFCERLLKKIGFNDTRVTPSSGDQGIDVLAKNGNASYGFQCKNYSNIIGNKAVQETIAGRAFYNLDKAVVIANNYFTNSAQELAREASIELWDRDKLYEIIKENKASV